MGLGQVFDQCLLPLAIEAGTCIFKITLISGVYILLRANTHEGIKKIKIASIGYVLLRSIDSYVKLIDNICASIKF